MRHDESVWCLKFIHSGKTGKIIQEISLKNKIKKSELKLKKKLNKNLKNREKIYKEFTEKNVKIIEKNWKKKIKTEKFGKTI